MTTYDQGSRDSTVTRDEVIGKIFVAMDQGKRLCLICDRVFTRQSAAEHAGAACHQKEILDLKEKVNMQIGEPLRTIVIEPLELPVDDPQTRPDPEPATQPEPQPEQVPAKR
jgi:hypothetical protein